MPSVRIRRIFLPLNHFRDELHPDRLRWAAAEGVSEDVIAAVLLLHDRSVDGWLMAIGYFYDHPMDERPDVVSDIEMQIRRSNKSRHRRPAANMHLASWRGRICTSKRP